jgi:DNA-binding transcriptional ArsR family regulator
VAQSPAAHFYCCIGRIDNFMKIKEAVIDDSPAMDEATLQFSVQLFSALAHPTRLRIVELLTASARTVNEVAQMLGILQPNASQHLAILNRAGVVKVTPDGVARSYSLRGPRIARVLCLVNEFRSIHASDLERLAQQEPVDI